MSNLENLQTQNKELLEKISQQAKKIENLE
jgi:hypothetical protein